MLCLVFFLEVWFFALSMTVVLNGLCLVSQRIPWVYLCPDFIFRLHARFCFVFFARPSLVAFQYDLTLVASDSLNEVEIPAVIYVRDLNDLPPEFEQMQYVVNITEETVFVDAPLIQVLSFCSMSSFGMRTSIEFSWQSMCCFCMNCIFIQQNFFWFGSSYLDTFIQVDPSRCPLGSVEPWKGKFCFSLCS